MTKSMREIFNEVRDAAFIDSNGNRVTYQWLQNNPEVLDLSKQYEDTTKAVRDLYEWGCEAFGAKRVSFEEFYKHLIK